MDNPKKVIEMKRPILSNLRSEFQKALQRKIVVPAAAAVFMTLTGITSLMFQWDALAKADTEILLLKADNFNKMERAQELDRIQKLIVDGYKLVNDIGACSFKNVGDWFNGAFNAKFVRTKDVPEHEDINQFVELLEGMSNAERQALVKRYFDRTMQTLYDTGFTSIVPKEAPKEDTPTIGKPEPAVI